MSNALRSCENWAGRFIFGLLREYESVWCFDYRPSSYSFFVLFVILVGIRYREYTCCSFGISLGGGDW